MAVAAAASLFFLGDDQDPTPDRGPVPTSSANPQVTNSRWRICVGDISGAGGDAAFETRVEMALAGLAEHLGPGNESYSFRVESPCPFTPSLSNDEPVETAERPKYSTFIFLLSDAQTEALATSEFAAGGSVYTTNIYFVYRGIPDRNALRAKLLYLAPAATSDEIAGAVSALCGSSPGNCPPRPTLQPDPRCTGLLEEQPIFCRE